MLCCLFVEREGDDMVKRLEFKDTSGFNWICQIDINSGTIKPDSVFWIDESGRKIRVVEDDGTINAPIMKKESTDSDFWNRYLSDPVSIVATKITDRIA